MRSHRSGPPAGPWGATGSGTVAESKSVLPPAPPGLTRAVRTRVTRDPLPVPLRDAGPGRVLPLGAFLPRRHAAPAGLRRSLPAAARGARPGGAGVVAARPTSTTPPGAYPCRFPAPFAEPNRNPTPRSAVRPRRTSSRRQPFHRPRRPGADRLPSVFCGPRLHGEGNMDPLLCGICACLALVLGLLLGYGGARVVDRNRLNSTQAQAMGITEAAQREAENIRKAAELASKEEGFRQREVVEREAEDKRNEMREHERRLEKREDAIEQKTRELQKKERSLENTHRKLSERKGEIEKRAEEVEALLVKQQAELHRISGLSRDDAQKLLLDRLTTELSDEVAVRIRRHEEQLKSVCDDKARQVLATCIHRYAAEHTADTTVSTVDIP